MNVQTNHGNKSKIQLPTEIDPIFKTLEIETDSVKKDVVSTFPLHETAFAYILECIESESGWGQKPDGFYIFRCEDDANEFIRKDNAEKSKTIGVPDIYWRYTGIGYRPICQTIVTRFNEQRLREFLYVDHLHELMSYNQDKYR